MTKEIEYKIDMANLQSQEPVADLTTDDQNKGRGSL